MAVDASLQVEHAAQNVLLPGESISGIYPATPLQTDLVNATEVNSTVYTGIGIWDIQCRTNTEILQAAWDAIVSANSILRSQFIITSDGTFRVEIGNLNSDRTRLHIETWDGSSSVDVLQGRLTSTLAERASMFRTPFMTAAIAHRPLSDETRFVLRMHHSLYDGETLQMIITDLLAFLSGSFSPRPQFCEFGAFVLAQNETRARDNTQQFWTTYLAGANMESRSEDVPLAGRRMMQCGKTALGAYDPHYSLTKFSVTFPNILRAAWALALSTVEGGNDHVFGEVFSGRDKAVKNIDRIMGPTLTTVPFRVVVQRGQTFGDFLSSIQSDYADILPHSQVSPMDLSTWLQTSPRKLFPSFIAINLYSKITEVNGQRAVFIHVPDAFEFQLAAVFDVIDGIVYATLAYDLNIISTEHASGVLRALVSSFKALHSSSIDALVTDFVDAQVGSQIVSFEPGIKSILPFKLAHDAFQYMAAQIPNSIAAEHGSETITYGQLLEKSNKLATHLHRLGVTLSVLVPIIIRRELTMLVAILAVLQAGGAFIPIAAETPTERIRHIVRESGCRVLLATSQEALEDHEEIQKHVDHVVVAADSRIYKNNTFNAAKLPRPTPTGIAYAIATSGTTGVPKIVLCPHEGVVNVVHDTLGNLSFGVDSKVGNFMGVAFDCSVGEIFSALSHGATLVLRRDDVEWSSVIATLDSLFITPTGLQLLKPQTFPRLRRISVAGEACPPALVKSWQQKNPKIVFSNIYGPSEATIFCTSATLGSGEVTIGRPIQNMVCRVLNNSLKRIPVDVPGELYVGGVGLASGYLNNPERTMSKFIDDPYAPGNTLYATGDIARWGSDGNLYYHGRKDASMDIKIRGHRVNLDEISYTISKHPSVQFCVCIVKDEAIVAFVSPVDINIPSVRDACASALPHYMIPTAFQLIDQASLPLNLNGKVDRQALEHLVDTPSTSSATPSTSIAQTIASVWADILDLDLDSIRWTRLFFEVGNSISAVRVARKLVSEGLKLSTSQLFRYQTIAELEKLLSARAPTIVSSASTEKPKTDTFEYEHGPQVPLPYELPVDSFERIAHDHPDAIAVELKDQRITYGELDSMSTKLAHYLLELEEVTSAMIPIVMTREPSMLIAILAVLKAGAAYIPVDAHAPSARVQNILTQCRANIVLFNSQKAAEDHLELLGNLCHVVVEAFDFRAYNGATGHALPRAKPQDTAYAIATSGTTGIPKLVCCPHQGVVNIVEWMNHIDDGLTLGVGSRVGNFAGIAFDASILDIFTALSRGATLVLRDDSADWASVIATLDVFNMTPTALQMVKPQVFPRLKRIILGGEALPASLVKAWKGLVPSMVNGYGPSETSIVITTASMSFDETNVPIGAPIQNSYCRILSAGRERVPIDEVGELYLGGIGVGAGYLYNDKATSRCFVPDPFESGQLIYATGDLARWGSDGKLYYHGRADVSEDVKVQGQRVNLDEISQVMLQYPGVQFAKAVVSSDFIVAFIAPETVDVAGLRESCAKLLPYYMVPTTFRALQLSEVPRTLNAKVDLHKLQKMVVASLSELSRKPTSQLGIIIAETWAEKLECDVGLIHTETSFFELPNGNSISAVRAVNALNTLGYNITVSKFFQLQTIAKLESALQSASEKHPNTSSQSFPNQTLLIAHQLHVHPEAIEDILPTTPLQSGMLVAMMKDRSKYAGAQLWDISAGSPVTVSGLCAAWERLVKYHAVLRTQFVVLDEGLFQVVLHEQTASATSPNIISCDLTTDIESCAGEAMKKDLIRGFILPESMARFSIITENGIPSRILLTMSHAIYDGWSLGILESDLRKFYVSEPSATPPSFSNFVRHIKDQAGDNAQQYWTDYLSGVIPSATLQLPSQVPSSASPSEIQNKTVRALSVSSDQLRQAAVRLRVTPAILANAAWAIVLHRFLGQNEMIFGNVLSGRDADIEGIESMVGMLLATVPVRVNFTKESTVEDLIKSLYSTHLNHLEYCHAGLINIQRWSNTSKMFSSLITFGVASGQGHDSGGALPIRRIAGEGDVSEYGADVTFLPGPSGLEVELVSDSAVLDPIASLNIVEELDHILQCIISPSRTGSPTSLIPLSPPQMEKFYAFGDGGAAPRPFETLHAGVSLAASRHPHTVALEHYDTTITYAELESWSNCLACMLQKYPGGMKGKFCGLLVDRSIEFVVGMLAILKAGSAFVPLDCSFPDDRLEYMVEAAQVEPILTTRTASKRKGRITRGHTVTYMEDFRTGYAAKPVDVAGGDDRSYIIFSSGTTGKPKPIVCKHAGAVNNIWFHPCMKHIQPGTRIGQMLAISFDGTLQEIFGGLFLGATVVLREENVFHTIKTLDVLSLTPSGLQQLDPDEYTNLKCVFTCGEALPTSLVQRWGPRVALYSDYGPTECCISTSCNTKPYVGDMPITLGRPFPNMSMYVLNSETKMPVPMGVIGELHIGGIGVGEGYYGRPELTEAKFVRNPFVSVHAPVNNMYCAGDLVRWLPHGELQFCGRDDTQVKLKGYRIELEEVATVMRQVPNVKDAVALIRSSDNGNILVGFVASTSVDVEDVRGACIMALPIYEVPAIVIRLERFPVTSIGKVDRAALQKWDLASATKEGGKTLSDKELAVQRAFVATLKISADAINASTSFFALGGDSISAIKLVSKAKDERLLVTVQQIFRFPTVEALASCAQELSPNPVPSDATVDVLGEVPLSAAQARYLRNAKQVNHFNQSRLLRPRHDVQYEVVRSAMYQLVRQHDMLRARFQRQEDGWKQIVTPFKKLDVDGQVEMLKVDGNMEPELQRLARSLDIVNGPLYLATLIHNKEEQYIFITVHHLVIDIVSFNIIIDDLEKILKGQTLGSKTTSFADCVLHLEKKALELDPLAWSSHLTNVKEVDDAVVKSVYTPSSQMRSVTASLSQVPSSRINSANNAYRTSTQELALTALALAFYSLFKKGPFALSLESHGRHRNVLPVDTSYTVGWFTSSYPVCLDLRGYTNDLRTAIMRVKEVVRNIPDGGMSYELLKYATSRADVDHIVSHRPAHFEFNFLGEMVQGGALFEDVPVSLDVDIHPDNLDIGIIVSCYFKNGALELDFYFDSGLYDPKLLDSLGQLWTSSMQKIIEHCNKPTSFGYSPSDFSAFRGDQSVLDEVEEEIYGLGIRTQDVEDIWPATSAQTAFFMSLMHGGGKYVSQTVYDLKGSIDKNQVSRAWDLLLASHPVLRSGFVSTSGGVFQVVSKPGVVSNPVKWLTWDNRDAENAQTDFLRNDQQRFNPTSPSFTSLTAIEIASTTCRLVFTQFHAISDGWSHALEMEDFLSALVNNRPLHRYPTFKEYSEQLTSLSTSDAKKYWCTAIGQGRRCASWTFAQPLAKGDVPSYKDHSCRIENVSEELGNVAASAGVTLSTLLRTLWALVLRHYTSKRDVIFGAVVSGRDTFEGAENIIGTLVNTIPVTIHLDKDNTLGMLLQKLHQQHVDSLAHSHASLSDIMKWNAITDLPSFFNTLFTFQNYPSFSAPDSLPFSISLVDATEYTEFDINMNISVVNHNIEITATYDTSRFEPYHIEGIVNKFAELLVNAVEPNSLTSFIDTFNQVSAADLRRLEALESGPVTSLPFECLHHGFEHWASIQPGAIAVEQATDKITYGALDAFANDLAAQLQQHGVGPGDFVPLVTTRCPDMVIAILGVLKTGAAYAPIDKDYPLDRIEYIINTCRPKVILCHPSTQTAVPKLKNLSFKSISVSRKNVPGAKPTKVTVTRDHPAYVIFTSGTTGKPKGVVCLHKGVVNVVMLSPARFGTKPGSRGASILSVSFDMGTWEVQSCLFNGATVAMRNDFNDVFRTVDTVFITPSALAQLTPDQLTNVKHIAVSGEPCPIKLKEEWTRRLHFHNSCAPSETTIVSFLGEMHPDERITMGPPIENSSCYLLDPATLERVPLGCTGEIFISGICVGAGYLRNPELTAKSFLSDPWRPGDIMFRSSDLGRWTPWGAVEHLGRRDDQVKVKGFRVELLEVIAGLRRHPGVTDAVALVKDGNLVAFVSPGNVDVKEVRKIAAGFLPSYMVPAMITAVKSIPLNQNGKVDKKALLAVEVLVPDEDLPIGELETMFAEIWASILKIDVHRISRRSAFYEVGGDSISALRVVAAAKKRGYAIKSALVANRKHTLAHLATLATLFVAPTTMVASTSLDTSSPIPLTPVMRWFFSLNWKNINWWNQSFLLASRTRISPDTVLNAITSLVFHHELLRARYVLNGSEWIQTVEPMSTHRIPVHFLSLKSFSEIESEVKRLQQKIDLEKGPLYQFAVFDNGREQRIWISVHHVCIDLVSWRILTEDLEHLLIGEQLTQPTTSFASWSNRLLEHASTLDRRAHLLMEEQLKIDNASFVQKLMRPDAMSLHEVDRSDHIGVGFVSVHIKPGVEELLNTANAVLDTNDQDLILAALLMSIRARLGSMHVPLAVVSHGRMPWNDDLDVSRTIGWFSTSNGSPYTFSLPDIEDVKALVEYTRSSLASTAQNGFNYQVLRWMTSGNGEERLGQAEAQVGFNYFGRWQVFASEKAYFQEDVTSLSNTWNNCEGEILHIPFSIIGQLTSFGELEVSAEFYSDIFDTATVSDIIGGWKNYMFRIFQAAGLKPSSDLFNSPLSVSDTAGDRELPIISVTPPMSLPQALPADEGDHGRDHEHHADHLPTPPRDHFRRALTSVSSVTLRNERDESKERYEREQLVDASTLITLVGCVQTLVESVTADVRRQRTREPVQQITQQTTQQVTPNLVPILVAILGVVVCMNFTVMGAVVAFALRA
uniref:Putative nonribosomal peptide synthetase n=1 Tax=Omphalotus olearius TaxID=72120 RepID=Q2VJ19_OMPOL|nr:putative nonribosomal peptide synthetase [Omphalotus olearius]